MSKKAGIVKTASSLHVKGGTAIVFAFRRQDEGGKDQISGSNLKKRLAVKKIHPLSIGILATFILIWNRCETSTRTEHFMRSSNINDTLLISISTQNGWSLDVYAEGDGILKYRSKANNSFHFDESTFEFDSLKMKLARRLRMVNFDEPPFLGVRIITSQQPTGLFYALTDEIVAADLFDKAFHAGLSTANTNRELNHLKKIYRIYPPIPIK